MAAVDKKYARLIAPEDPKIEAWRSLFSLVTDDDPDELDQAVKDLGAQSEDLEVEVMGYGTLLSYAAQNSVDVCAHLLEEHRLNPNTRSSTEKDQTALFDAKGGAVLVLIERGADERLQNSEGETAFTAAVKRGDYTQALDFLKNGLDVTSRNESKDNPLFLAAALPADVGQEDAEERFWEFFFELCEDTPALAKALNAKCQGGNTCLHAAADKKREDLIKKMLEFGADPDSHNSSGQLPFIPPHLLEHLEVRQLGGNRNEGEGEETGVILTGGGDVKDKKGPTIEAVAQEAEAEDAELLEELAREEERIRKEEQQRAEELEEENKRKQEEERLAAEIQAAAEASRQEVEQQATATAAAENAQTNNEGQEAEDPAGATEGEGVEQQNDEKEGEPPTLEKGATQGTDKLTAALGEGQDGDKEGEGPSEILKPQRSAQLSEAPGGGQKTRPTSEASSSDAGSEGEDDEGDQRPVTGHSSDDEHYPGPEEAQEGPEDTKEEQKPSIDPKKAAALAFLKEQEVMEKESEELLRTTTEAAKSHESLQEDNALLERRVAFLLWKGANQHKGEQAGGAQGQGTAGTGAGPASSRMGAPPTEEKKVNVRKYLSILAQVHAMHTDLRSTVIRGTNACATLQEKLEEKREKTQRAADAFNIFRRTMIDNAVYSLSGKPIPKAVVQMLEDLSAAKDGEVEQHRGAVVALQNRFRRLDKSLKDRGELSHNLNVIDFEQLKIENQTLNEKIEERNEELHKLKKKTMWTIQVSTHMREKLESLDAEKIHLAHEVDEAEDKLQDQRALVSKTKAERDKYRQENAATRLRTGLINTDLLSADYAERRQSIQELNEKIAVLKARHEKLTAFISRGTRHILTMRSEVVDHFPLPHTHTRSMYGR